VRLWGHFGNRRETRTESGVQESGLECNAGDRSRVCVGV
jgi:hypothetical protein